jgi:hypothetical protein
MGRRLKSHQRGLGRDPSRSPASPASPVTASRAPGLDVSAETKDTETELVAEQTPTNTPATKSTPPERVSAVAGALTAVASETWRRNA